MNWLTSMCALMALASVTAEVSFYFLRGDKNERKTRAIPNNKVNLHAVKVHEAEDSRQAFFGGFARLDKINKATKQWIEASVIAIGVCARYDNDMAGEYLPYNNVTTPLQSFRVQYLDVWTKIEAEMKFDYFLTKDCSQTVADSSSVFFGVGMTTVNSMGVEFLTILSHIEILSNALALVPPHSRAFVTA